MSAQTARSKTPFRRLRLLPAAWRLHTAAQRLSRDAPLPEVSASLVQAPDLPTDAAPEDAVWAAAWVARLQRRLLGRLDTCLVRSLVAGALIADAPQVAVRIGVQGGGAATDLLDAHAWLSVGDRPIPAAEADPPFDEVLAVVMERSA